MNDKYSLTSALEAKKSNNLEEWIHSLLMNGYNDNIDLSNGIKQSKRYFCGPVKLPLSLFTRVCGPEETMEYQVNEAYFHYHVEEMMEWVKQGWDIPPILIEQKDDRLFMNDGNHRFEALKRLNYREYYFILWGTSKVQKQKINNLLQNMGKEENNEI